MAHGRENCFEYNGGLYPTGIVLRIRGVDKHGNPTVKRAVFIWHIVDKDWYVIHVDGHPDTYTKERFYNNLIEVVGEFDFESIKDPLDRWKIDTRAPTLRDELNADGMIIGWAWYIFVMVISTLFYDRIGMWIFASIVFFKYRRNKLREAGFKK